MFNERDPRMMLQRRLNEETSPPDSLGGDDSVCAVFHEVTESSVLDRTFFRMKLSGSGEDSLPGDG